MTFHDIYDAYDERFKAHLSDGELPMRSTEYGFYGSASLHATYEFFTKHGLQRYESFLDLGSGDGRVVLCASLFTTAHGVEGDPELVETSKQIRDDVDVDCSFTCADFYELDWSDHDMLFINPDSKLDERFMDKARGSDAELVVYNDMYLPCREPDDIVEIGEIGFHLYDV